MRRRALRSNFEPGSPRWAVRRAQWRALGLGDDDLDKPKIAVINTSSELSSCFSHLDGVAARVKQAIRAAGALAFEVRTAAPSDFITSAGRQGRYILPSRDLLVNEIEVQVEGALLDGMVCLASCDKTAPGQLMAAARLDLPSIIVPCGYQSHGSLDNRDIDIEEVYESVGKVATGEISLQRLGQMCDVAIGGPGVCAGMGTANTMHIASEALGMALPGSTPVLANSPRMFEYAEAAGRRIVDLVWEDVRPRSILTPQAFENAVMVGLALSASINLVRHLQAIAIEAQCPVDLYELYDRLGPKVPLLCAVRPNGTTRIEDLEIAGGTRAVLKRLESLVHRESLTVDGRTWGEVLAAPGDVGPVLRTLEDPISRKPSVIVMRGNLAPEGSILKLGDASAKESVFTGRALVFWSQEDALHALRDGRINLKIGVHKNRTDRWNVQMYCRSFVEQIVGKPVNPQLAARPAHCIGDNISQQNAPLDGRGPMVRECRHRISPKFGIDRADRHHITSIGMRPGQFGARRALDRCALDIEDGRPAGAVLSYAARDDVGGAYEVRDETAPRVVVDFERRPFLLDPAIAHDDHAVGHRHRLFLVVRDVYGAQLKLTLQLPHLFAHAGAQPCIEVG